MASQTIPLPATTRRPKRSEQLVALIPGTLLLFAIGLAGKGLESLGIYLRAHHHYFPRIEYVLWAIILGLLISNLYTLPAIFPSRHRHLRAMA